MKCFNCIHYDVCSYHIDEETAELTVLDDTQEKEANVYVCDRFLK